MKKILLRICTLSAPDGRNAGAVVLLQLYKLFFILVFLVRPEGLEPSTPCLEGRCSIHLSYGRA